jgi:hypothetical protein
MDIVLLLLKLILARRYQSTDHAIESMDEDGLTLNDVISCLSRGRLRRTWKRQRKYEVQGQAVDGRAMRIVDRLIGTRLLRIITVYEVK